MNNINTHCAKIMPQRGFSNSIRHDFAFKLTIYFNKNSHSLRKVTVSINTYLLTVPKYLGSMLGTTNTKMCLTGTLATRFRV